MSEQKYIGIDVDGLGITCELQPNGTYKALHVDEVVALLNTPPAAGVVWKKPGEAGRVHGNSYMVWWRKGVPGALRWIKQNPHDGWGRTGILAWAEINPPAWATGGAA